MKRRAGLIAAAGVIAGAGSGGVQAQVPPPLGELKALGGERFQIGRVLIDKQARRFTVPGRVHAKGMPLEYLATSPGGMKAYETLFELDATGSEINLACILIGLEQDPKHVATRRQSPQTPLLGPRVAITVAWLEAGARRTMSAAEALVSQGADVKPEAVEWVYAGAPAQDSRGLFAADVTGTLVGFKRDENNVIESALGIGIGAYGSIRGAAALPEKGGAIELVFAASPAAK